MWVFFYTGHQNYTYLNPPSARKRTPGNGRPFPGHHYYKLNFMIHATKKREKILKFHYRTCIRTPPRWLLNLHYWKTLLVIITYSVLAKLSLGLKNIKNIMHFHYMSYMATPLL